MLAGLMTIGAATLYVWRHQARRDIRYSADTGHGGLDTRA
jgi:transposase-like protein